jgi:hypothetical protein
MVYNSEAMLPSKLQYGSPRVHTNHPNETDQEWHDTVDLLKELRDITVTRSARYQQTP